ncbi:hypothetical protein BH11PSE12_BH11PSE12_24350 [soil metagenome]
MSSPFSGNDNSALGAMSDPLNFVKNLWGGMQVPGMVTPTVSVDELDKKIKDLKTVESWLNVNMTMLRGTIQALEVQRSTIATLKSMGETFAQQMSKATEAAAATGETGTANTNSGWPMPAAEASKKPVPEPETVAAATAAQPVSEAKPEAKSAASTDKTEAASASPFANAANLWNLLQDQFKQAVSSAMEGEQMILGASQPAEAKTTARGSAKSAVHALPAVNSAGKAKAKPRGATSTAKVKSAAKATPAAAKPGRKRAAP